MIAFSNKPRLGYGIYTVADVATILHLPKEKVRRWLQEYWDLRLAPQIDDRSSWGSGRGKSVNFYALVEFYVFYALRKHGVSTSRIVKAHRALRQQFGTPYPFASHKIMTDGRSVLFSPDEGESVLDATTQMQYNLKEVIEAFIDKIDFGPKDQIALRLHPDGKAGSVVVDPHHQFGQPIISGTNILASTLFNLYKNGEKIDFIASLYELSEDQVNDAVQFFQKAA